MTDRAPGPRVYAVPDPGPAFVTLPDAGLIDAGALCLCDTPAYIHAGAFELQRCAHPKCDSYVRESMEYDEKTDEWIPVQRCYHGGHKKT